MGLTATGYTRATYEDIVNAKILKAKELFGEDIETSEQTPLGKFIRINAYDQAKAEELAEQIYYARFPNTAVGVSLDRLCVFVGITRNPATAAQYSVRVTGTVGHVIPMGFLVGTENGVRFYNLNEETIGEDGLCTIVVDCETAGEIGNVNFNEITEIVNPDADITSVQGFSRELLGTEEETDYALRKRFKAATEGQGSCSTNAIKAALMRVETVTSASVVENDTDNTVNGRPPHSFECYVSGGENYHKKIAETIFDKKPIGIKTYGSQSYEITDDSGQPYTVYFSHTENISIEVNIRIKTNASYNGDTATAEIKENIVSYINSLGVGGSVFASALYGKIHAVTGVEYVETLALSSADAQVVEAPSIPIGAYQTAVCTESDISIEVVA